MNDSLIAYMRTDFHILWTTRLQYLWGFKEPPFFMIYKNCFVSLYWAFHMKINGQWMHWSSKIYIRSMDQKNIKLSEVHFNTCLLTSSSKPQEFAVGTAFEKCPQKCGFRGRKIQTVYLIILWDEFSSWVIL